MVSGKPPDQDINLANLEEASVNLSTQIPIESVFISPNQEFAYIGSNIGDLYKVKLSTSDVLTSMPLAEKEILGIEQMGSNLITASLDGKVSILDSELNVINQVQFPYGITAFSNSSSIIYIADSKGEIHILNSNLQEIDVFKAYNQQQISATCLSADNNLLAIGYQRGEIIIWNLKASKAEEILPGHTSSITDLSFSKCKIIIHDG